MSASSSAGGPDDLVVSEDTLALSFLDVLSCGFGAAIYLFLVFAAMPHLGNQQAHAVAAANSAAAVGSTSHLGVQDARGLAAEATIGIKVVLLGAMLDAFPANSWVGLPNRATKIRPYELEGDQIGAFASVPRGSSLVRTVSFTLIPERLDPAKEIVGEITLWVGGTSRCVAFKTTRDSLVDAVGSLFTLDFHRPEKEWLQVLGGTPCGG